MVNMPQNCTDKLVDRLAHALAGSDGRTISVDAIRSLANIEINEWKQEDLAKPAPAWQSVPLIAGTIGL